jgi:hypothetical protein
MAYSSLNTVLVTGKRRKSRGETAVGVQLKLGEVDAIAMAEKSEFTS